MPLTWVALPTDPSERSIVEKCSILRGLEVGGYLLFVLHVLVISSLFAQAVSCGVWFRCGAGPGSEEYEPSSMVPEVLAQTTSSVLRLSA